MKNIFRLLLWVTVVTIPVISGYAQGKGNLSGVVKDDMGETLPGAAIIVREPLKELPQIWMELIHCRVFRSVLVKLNVTI